MIIRARSMGTYVQLHKMKHKDNRDQKQTEQWRWGAWNLLESPEGSGGSIPEHSGWTRFHQSPPSPSYRFLSPFLDFLQLNSPFNFNSSVFNIPNIVVRFKLWLLLWKCNWIETVMVRRIRWKELRVLYSSGNGWINHKCNQIQLFFFKIYNNKNNLLLFCWVSKFDTFLG